MNRNVVLWVVIAAFIAVVGRISEAAEDPTVAQAAYKRGLRAFANKNYVEAAEAFEVSVRARKSIEGLYGWAQSERLAGDCIRAVGLYREILSMELSPSQNEKTRAALALCADAVVVPEATSPPEQAVSPAEAGVIPPAEAEVAVVPRPPTAVSETTERPRWYADPLGHVLFVGGVAVLGAGLGLYFSSASSAADAPMADTLQDYQDQRSSAEALRIVSLLSMSAGGALALIGVYRYATVGGDSAPVAIWIDARGGHLAWRGTF